MPVAADLLQRFRPAGAPGSATVAGVPEDLADRRAAELDPVFAALAATHARVARILAAADVEARRLEEDATRRAETIRSGAAQEAEAAGAEVLARARARATDVERAGAESAAREAERVAASATAALDADVAAVCARVHRRLAVLLDRGRP